MYLYPGALYSYSTQYAVTVTRKQKGRKEGRQAGWEEGRQEGWNWSLHALFWETPP
jgi:predicted transposase YdaD